MLRSPRFQDPSLFYGLSLCCALLLGACQGAPEVPQDPSLAALPTAATLTDGWNTIETGGETLCSQGTPYNFHVRPASAEKLMVYFQGGGACWNGMTCDLTMQPTYDPVANEEDNPANAPAGIFDLANPDNPFADYTMVFVPYCSGDVHLGNNVQTYDVPATDSTEAHQVTIHHKGYVNSRMVLDWVQANYTDPEMIFVTGSSAGSIPSPFYADLLATHYAEAQVIQLGDASGGYGGDSSQGTVPWNVLSILPEAPEYAGLTAETLSFQALFHIAAQRHPDLQLAAYDNAQDNVQRYFISLGAGDGQDPDLLPLLRQNYSAITAEVPDFRAYVPPGEMHTILGRPEFYTTEVNGLRFRDWVANLAAGTDVETVICDPCAVPAD